MKNKRILWRVFFYLAGMIILAMGITLNTKTGLGVSPIISVPYCVASIWNLNFGNIAFLMYIILVLIQVVIKNKNTRVIDLFQIMVSVVFTRFLNFFSGLLDIHSDNILFNIGLLFIAILLTGVGAAMSVNARLVANPGDGIVQTIADATKKDMGLIKNLVDLTCIITSVTISLIFNGKLVGIGLGTVIAVFGVGRVIWLYNKLFKEKIELISGMKVNIE